MFRNTNSVIVAGVLCLLATSPIVAQTATLVGIAIADSLGTPVAGAEVSIVSLGLRATTNYLGEFRFSRLPAGRITINVRRLGFVPMSDTVTLAENAATNREFQLNTQVARLDSVRVTEPERKYISPGLTEFEERRKEGRGYFVSEEVLRKNNERSMLDVIVANVPGLTRLRTNPRKPSEYYVGTTRKCAAGPAILACKGQSPSCPVTLYIDGHMLYSAAPGRDQDLPDLTSFAVRDYAGVEYYPGGATAPVKYNATDSGCGLLILWTRER